MDIKKILLKSVINPYIVELILSKVFKRTKRFAFEQMENCLEEIKEYLIETKNKVKGSPDPYDEEILNLGITSLQEFAASLNKVLLEVKSA